MSETEAPDTAEIEAPCGGARRSRTDWMGPDQYETCLCVRPKGHAGPHACDHDNPADALTSPEETR